MPAAWNLQKILAEDPERSKGIESWYRKVNADIYRKEADLLDVGLEGSIVERLSSMFQQAARAYSWPRLTVITAQVKSNVSSIIQKSEDDRLSQESRCLVVTKTRITLFLYCSADLSLG